MEKGAHLELAYLRLRMYFVPFLARAASYEKYPQPPHSTHESLIYGEALILLRHYVHIDKSARNKL